MEETKWLKPSVSVSRIGGSASVQPKDAFVAGLRPSQLPGRAACQLPDQSTIIRVRPSLTDSSRPRGARSKARFEHRPITSAPTPDILGVRRQVANVPVSEVAQLMRAKRKAAPRRLLTFKLVS